jgi:myo-inositol-1-phosphate synthase
LGEIRVALAGVGNCCSALVQGVEYYRGDGKLGLLHPTLGKYSVGDIRFVAAFDIDSKKVGMDLSDAIHAEPNKAPRFMDIGRAGVKVQVGPAPDRVGNNSMSHIEKAQGKPTDVAKTLRDAEADLLVNLI